MRFLANGLELGCASVLWLVGCGGSTSSGSAAEAGTDAPLTEDDGGGGSPDAADAVAPDSTPPDGASPDAAPQEGGSPDGGLPPNPGVLACGSTTCTAPGQECCLGGGPDAGTCIQPPNLQCTTGPTQQCQETGDCPRGQVCCLGTEAAANGAYETLCMTSCQASAQACRTTAECVNGGQCVAVPNCRGRGWLVEYCTGASAPPQC
jgi:hypothetical protein